MNRLRFARFAAVSTKEQAAADKFSIPSQLERTAQVAAERGWIETKGPFIVSGQSRTKYLTLEAAEREIEPLRLMLASARNREFDILILAEFDRLRELLDPVFRTLAAYKIQIYSLAQAIEPISPDDYDQYSSDSVAMLIGLSSITSRADISRFRRKWREQMPKRVTERGLQATSISWGYRKAPGHETDRKAIPESDPIIVPHLLHMRDMLIDGRSIRQIIDYLNEQHISPPKGNTWHPQTVRDILKNPFYAGIVSWGKSRVYLDPYGRRRRNRKIPSDEIITAPGKHTPLWDVATHDQLAAILRSRSKSYRGRKNNQFTGLLRCGVCGAPLWRQENGPRNDRLIWRCSMNRIHPNILHSKLIEDVGSELIPALQPFLKKQNSDQNKKASVENALESIKELDHRLRRLEDAYLSGHFDLDRYVLRKNEIQNNIKNERDKLADSEHAAVEKQNWLKSVNELSKLQGLTDWLRNEDQLKINRRLHLLLEKIIIHPARIEIIFKD